MKKDAVLYRDIGEILTLEGAAQKKGRHIQIDDLGSITGASLVVRSGKVLWVGPQKKVPKEFSKLIGKEISLQKKTVLPGFVECHTHLVFAGDRSKEFELRNQGVSYQEIAKQGGGILSTMRETRQTSSPQLLKLAQARVNRFVAQGVTSLEAKSGYALNAKDEVRVLSLHKKLKGPRIISTFLGAHARPPEFADTKEYLHFLESLLPPIWKKKLASRVDAFVENGFFSAEELKPFLKKAKDLGFAITLHADQLSLSGGAELAVEFKAQSADHLICVQEKQIRELSQSEVTAVLLPAADLYMKCAYPPARKMIESGVRVALATDFNPGSSPTQDLSLVGMLARLEMKMTLPEVISALTLNAAFALGIESEVGSLQPNKSADFLVADENWRHFFYSAGTSFVNEVFREGKRIFKA